ncbi:hypothetical protein ACHAO5_004168 [Verticillium nonalfalfae]
MAFKKHGRKYDVVVFGATGYTGQFAAEHIATHLPSNLRWAVAGRSESKLQKVVADCEKLNPDRVQPEVEICNLNDRDLQELAKKTFVLISAVGPYGKYGEHAFKACAENGTHYFDVTGEVPFVAKMISKYGKAAQASGALMFPEVGLESAPPDLMTWAMAKIIRDKLSAKTGEVTVSIHTLDAAPSGGTLATVLTLLDNFSVQEVQASFRPYALSPIPNPTRAPSRDTILTKIFGARHVPELGTVTTSLAGTTDAAIVQRSWGLHTSLNEQESYGPNFSFKEYFRVRNLLHGVFVHIALFLGIIILGTPLRRVAHRFVYQPGQGPAKADGKKDRVEYRATAIPDVTPKSDKIAFSRLWFDGSMYDLSGMMMAQGALSLLEDNLELPGGVYTASCLGQKFVDRVGDAGLKMEVKLMTP